jgi:hypothetical protein
MERIRGTTNRWSSGKPNLLSGYSAVKTDMNKRPEM